MQIKEASVQMSSARVFTQRRQREERLNAWVGERPPATPENGKPVFTLDRVSLSSQNVPSVNKHDASSQIENADDDLGNSRLRAMRLILEALTGKKVQVTRCLGSGSCPALAAPPSLQGEAGTPPPADRVGWGLEYTASETYTETEATDFSASVQITTTDGREIKGDITLSLRREYQEAWNLSVRAGDARLTDPLVINFATGSATMGQDTFEFDINADGKPETLPALASGSGFLWLDANGDNIVNNGKELFGPATDNGFKELAALDGDGNGWLDSADSSFEKLRIWTRESGVDTATTLAQRGIGAILLTGVSTGFSLTSPDNSLLGRIKETGLFVREDGSLGTVQELDLKA